MRKFDSAAVIKLKRVDLSGVEFDELRTLIQDMLVLHRSADPVELRRRMMLEGQRLFDIMPAAGLAELDRRMSLKGTRKVHVLPPLPNRKAPTVDVSPPADVSEDYLLAELLHPNAREEDFSPAMWEIRAEYKRVTEKAGCSGCALKQAMANARKSMRAIL